LTLPLLCIADVATFSISKWVFFFGHKWK
jgi:hypothetical protein